MRSGKREKERSKRNNRNKDADWPCGGKKNYIEREKKSDRQIERERRDFSSIS